MRILTILSILFSFAAHGLLAQNVAFSYDADGNMTSRYVVTLRSAMVQENEEEAADVQTAELSEQKITIFPNPTKGQIAVEITPFDGQQECSLRLYDASGKLIIQRKIDSDRTELEITGNPGVYLLDILLGKNVSKWKIIKQ